MVIPRGDFPLHHPDIDDDPPVAVVIAVEDQGFERLVIIRPLGRRDIPDDPLQHLMDIDAVFGGDPGRVQGGDADDILDLVGHPLRVGGGQVDLVDDRHYLQVVVHRQIGVGQGLGLDALGCVHHQNRSLAGGQGTGNLVVEVHMAGGIDEVELIILGRRRLR